MLVRPSEFCQTVTDAQKRERPVSASGFRACRGIRTGSGLERQRFPPLMFFPDGVGQGSTLCRLPGTHTAAASEAAALRLGDRGKAALRRGVCAVPGPSLLDPDCPVFWWLRRAGSSESPRATHCTVYQTLPWLPWWKSRDYLREFKSELHTVSSHLPSLLRGSSLCSYPNRLKVHFNPPRITGFEARAREPTRWALLNASPLSFLPQTFLPTRFTSLPAASSARH